MAPSLAAASLLIGCVMLIPPACFADDTTPTNGAKCSGDNQDQSGLIGTYNCSMHPPPETINANLDYQPHMCTDNLAHAKFFAPRTDGFGACHEFDSLNALSGKTLAFDVYKVGSNEANQANRDFDVFNANHITSVTSKVQVIHPHKADKNVGGVAAKRVVCTNSTGSESCEVFKTGLCIKCPVNVFQSNKFQEATYAELSKFARCCVRNEAQYTEYEQDRPGSPTTIDPNTDCPEDLAGGAFSNTSTTAALKADYECNSDDFRIFEFFLKSY
jgi:hypothetical protein